MRREIFFVLLVIIGVSITGCTQKEPATMNTLQNKSMNYSIGDVLIEYPGDLIGYVILEFDSELNPDTYLVSPVIMDVNGQTYFLGDLVTERIDRQNFENKYTLKAGHVEDPYWMERMIPNIEEKFESGDVVAKTNTSKNGLLVLRYDYSHDEYSFANAEKSNGDWKFNMTARKTGARNALETDYKEIVAKIPI